MSQHLARALRAAIYPVLGAALLVPAAVALGLVIVTEVTPVRVLTLWAVCLPVSVLLAAAPLVRRIETVALSELLDVDVPAKADPLYLMALTSLHLYGGATLGAGLLLLAPGLTRAGDLTGWRQSPAEMAQPFLLAGALVAVMVVAGLGQRSMARRLLRAEPSRALEELGRRQTLALELHDSVGHALSVVLVQGMAAQAVLRRPEPRVEQAAESLEHLLDTARAAQEELDVLLGVLDDGDTARAPTLDALGSLTRGLDVRVRAGDLGRVPAATSRAAYAIAREALTNALRHGRGPVTLDVAVAGDLVLTVENATGTTSTPAAATVTAAPPAAGVTGGAGRDPAERGRGLTGMRLRARLVGGTCTLEEADATWRVRARLPL